MKLHLLVSSLILAAAFTTRALAIDELTTLPPLVVAPNTAIERGMNRDAVREMIGPPGAQLSPDIWVYFDFRAVNLPNPSKGDTLIVAFIQDRVSYLKLVDGKPVRALIARQQQKGKPPATVVASK